VVLAKAEGSVNADYLQYIHFYKIQVVEALRLRFYISSGMGMCK